MKIRIGYELIYDCPQPTPMILTLSVHYTRVSDIIIPDHLIADPPVPLTAYRDSRQLVQPYRRAQGSGQAVHRCAREGYGPAGCGCLVGETDAGGRTARRDPAVPVGEPILRDRSAVPGGLGTVRQVTDRMGGASRRSATTSTGISHLATSTRSKTAREAFQEGPAFAVITRTSPSPSVAA